jgi:hypothetical protein
MLAAVPALGAIELGLHVHQTRDVVPMSDWASAREMVRGEIQADDLVLFAPFWADPIGRQVFGSDIVTLKRAAFADVSRFRRTFEVSIRGAHREELARWKRMSERRIGAVTVGLYENPAYAKVLDDLIDLVRPETLAVERVENGVPAPCAFARGQSQGGSTAVPQGMLVPAAKFACSGGYVGVAVLHALDHHPHLCVAAPPLGGGAVLRLRFANVAFGRSLAGHAGVQWVNDRTPSQERVQLSFSAFERPIGVHSHRVGTGFTGFEFPTEELEAKRGELVAEISGASVRGFCFEGVTR